MTNNFRTHIKKLLLSLVLTVSFSTQAGSYDDFFRAIKQDNAGAIQALIRRGFDPNTLDPDTRHGLWLALFDESWKAAEVLIESPGTNVNFLNDQGESALMMAALKGQLPLARKLINKGADVNKTGWTPLHYAASGHQIEMLRLLLDQHAFVDPESPNGSTPLMMAAQYGTTDMVKLLLEEGAIPTLKNQQNLTALDFAQRGSRPDAIKILGQAVKRSNASTR